MFEKLFKSFKKCDKAVNKYAKKTDKICSDFDKMQEKVLSQYLLTTDKK